MALFGSPSYYQQELQRVAELIKESLVRHVLQHLPHLQLTEHQQRQKWELVALSINNEFARAIIETKDKESENWKIPQCNGPELKEMFQEHEKKFQVKVRGIISTSRFTGLDYKESFHYCESDFDFMMYELLNLKASHFKQLGDLSREQHAKEIKSQFELLTRTPEIDEGVVGGPIKKLIEEHQETLDKIKLQAYEQEITKKNKRLEQMMKENRRLLELTRELTNGKNNGDEKY